MNSNLIPLNSNIIAVPSLRLSFQRVCTVEMDMTRGPSRILPVTLGRILRARRKVHSASQALIGRLKQAPFNIEFSAGLAIGRIESLNHCFAMTVSTADRPYAAAHNQRLAIDQIRTEPNQGWTTC
jgi:hypothetical protein